jgi:hypothetical protein
LQYLKLWGLKCNWPKKDLKKKVWLGGPKCNLEKILKEKRNKTKKKDWSAKRINKIELKNVIWNKRKVKPIKNTKWTKTTQLLKWGTLK